MEEQRTYCTILIKRRISGDPGPPAFLAPGELAMNEGNSTLYIGTQNSQLSSEEKTVTDLGLF
jgi:hypothetical protein